ncbi:competence type IV pilus major pilin ComGC [Roseiconus lacunae]|uniref:Prepilin-type N-terminal cleavage/methylation domain-containing protein n=1 Tax=Roseiconus lacunae TaxID=2605694 RepID=A0ABT7PJE6_9BACT|nr:hypothetical protein [Roseiconus lacunae]MDM4016626.1 hypothetical protein [Roseiconus lacunae]WRQ49494.1 hypothetical protein U8335_21360 [Stieleria sp. HD01]
MIGGGACFGRRGVSYLEVLACVTIIGVISLVIVPRLGRGKEKAMSAACQLNVEMIEVQATLFHRRTGRWPNRRLTDLEANADYFPEGIPVCPVDQSAYTFDTGAGRVNGHQH